MLKPSPRRALRESPSILGHAQRLREKKSLYNKTWKKNNPEKIAAHDALNRAVKAGLVKKLRTCQRCGKKPRRIYGHHANYSKPLEVEWLCGKCHLAEHGMKVS